MISRKIFDTDHSPSINSLSPIHNTNNYSLNNRLNQVINNQDDKRFINERSQGKQYKQQQKIKENERGTQEKNSFLLKSYEKYDNIERENNNYLDQRSTVKEGYSRQRSDNKSRSNSPIFNSNKNYQNNLSNPASQILTRNQPPQSSLPSQYQLLLQYELKREKEKNEILQKRLSNKQDFIKQMKNIQQDLTIAYAKCQQELNQANTLIYELKTNSTKQVRDYKQQIEQLKHEIAILQQNQHNSKNQLSRKQSIDNHPINNQSSLYYNDSFKKQIQVEKKYLKSKSTINLTRHQSTGQVDVVNKPLFNKKLSIQSPHFVDLKQLKINENKNNNKKQQNSKQNSRDKDMIRSNTHSVILTDFNKNTLNNSKPKKQVTPLNSHYSSISPNYQLQGKHTNLLHMIESQFDLTEFQVEIISNISKVSNFLQHFIDMCQKMIEIQQQQNKSPNDHNEIRSKQNEKREKSSNKQHQKTKLIHQLKKYWKWIKQVIRQWKDMKNQKKIKQSKSKKLTQYNKKNNQFLQSQVQNYQRKQSYPQYQEHHQTFQQL